MSEIETAMTPARDLESGSEMTRYQHSLADVALMSSEELQRLESLVITGLNLIDDKMQLIGIPHRITAVTYWLPPGNQIGMVSLEATVGSKEELEKALERSWIPGKSSLGELPVDPEERIVYNDGSTGIRRQITAMLSSLKDSEGKFAFMDVGEIKQDSDYDKPWTEWGQGGFRQWRSQGADKNGDPILVPSFTSWPDGKPLVIGCRHGLRVSEYDNEYAQGARTFYLS